MRKFGLKALGLALMLFGFVGWYSFANAANKPEVQAQIPATAEAVWQAIDQHVAQLAKVIQPGALGEVHHHAFAIRDLVAALPERSRSMSADKLAQVKANVIFVATLAERLDAAGDAKDKAGAELNFGKLKNVLTLMRKYYTGS